MRNSFTLLLCFCFISLLSTVISAPIPAWDAVVDNQPSAPNDPDSQKRVADFNEANTRAKEMVDNMVKVVNSQDPKHVALVNAAFGPNADRAKIKDTVEKLNTQRVHVDTTDVAHMSDKLIAKTPMPNRPNGPAGPVQLGPKFFEADASKDFRAGTLIHEATHQLAFTGDYINNKDKVIGALEPQKQDVKIQANKDPSILYQFPGPAKPKEVPKTEADLSQKYKDNLHTVQDTHNGADPYRVLAHLCSQPGIFPRDALLFTRAFIDADHEERRWLLARDGEECKLPPDYFKKKAEAKAAAEKKTAGQPVDTKAPTSNNPPSHPTDGKPHNTDIHHPGANGLVEHPTSSHASETKSSVVHHADTHAAQSKVPATNNHIGSHPVQANPSTAHSNESLHPNTASANSRVVDPKHEAKTKSNPNAPTGAAGHTSPKKPGKR